MLFKKIIFLLAAMIMALFLSAHAGLARAVEPVVLEVGVDLPVVEVRKPQRVVIRALVKPGQVIERRRVPLAVAIVLDKSGSMSSGRKMENAKFGALEALRMLDNRDVAAVVTYDSGVRLLVPPTPAGKYDVFSRAIGRIQAGGSTALYDGVQEGARALRPYISEGYVPRIVMLSDGMANVGPSSTRELSALGRRLAGQEMTITTIGLGLDYNEDLMTALAAESGGNSYFAKTADSLTDIFLRDMEDAVTLTARRVRITLTCDGEVKPVRALGRAGESRGASIEVPIDNLYGAEKYALFEVELPAHADASTLRAATVKLEYVDADSGATIVREAPLNLTFTKNAGDVEKNRRGEIVAQAELARNAEIREEVIRMADEGRAKEAVHLLNERTEDLKLAAPAAGAAAPKMQAEAEALEELAKDLENRGSMTPEQRKFEKNRAYEMKNQQAPVNSKD